MIHEPGKAFGCSFIRMLEVIAWVPFKNGVDAVCRQEFMLPMDTVADLCHNRIFCLLLLVAKAEIDCMGLWLVGLSIFYPLRVPDGW